MTAEEAEEDLHNQHHHRFNLVTLISSESHRDLRERSYLMKMK